MIIVRLVYLEAYSILFICNSDRYKYLTPIFLNPLLLFTKNKNCTKLKKGIKLRIPETCIYSKINFILQQTTSELDNCQDSNTH
jgi:hypothetical protein